MCEHDWFYLGGHNEWWVCRKCGVRKQASYQPEYFKPGTLVVLDPIVWNVSPPGTLGLIVELTFNPIIHTVLVGDQLVKAHRRSFIGAYNG